METGKYGVKLWCYAVAAFIFGVLDLYLGVIAVAAFAILAEKNKWLNNQVIQALLLYLLYQLLVLIIAWSFGGLGRLFQLMNLFSAAATMTDIVNIINGVLYVTYIVFTVIAIFRCLGGKDGVSFLANLSAKFTDQQKVHNEIYDDIKADQDDDEQ
jgi:hypothetical protein